MAKPSPRCPFRYLLRGRTFCALAIVESRYLLNEVIPPTCASCPIPELLVEHPCGRLDLGVEISATGGRQCVEMCHASCEVTVERLLDLSGCGEGQCPYFEAWDEERATRLTAEARERQLNRSASLGQS